MVSQLLSRDWPNANQVLEDANDLLIRGGFLRQAYSGVFHLLPLGLRVQDKLEGLIDKHMRGLGKIEYAKNVSIIQSNDCPGASKVSLSSISSQELWERSGRLTEGSEVFRFQDRKDARFLLAPTHEEEITTLVGGLTTSYKNLPLRVYQICERHPIRFSVRETDNLQQESIAMSRDRGKAFFVAENLS